MDHGTMALLIPILIFSIPIVAIWTGHKQKMAKIQAAEAPDVSGQLAEQVTRHTRDLEERVRVLERIVTDKGFDVAHQIEALRDARPMAGQAVTDRSGARIEGSVQ